MAQGIPRRCPPPADPSSALSRIPQPPSERDRHNKEACGDRATGDESAEKDQHPARWYFRKRLRERAESAVTQTSSHNALASAPDQADPARGPPAKQPRPQQEQPGHQESPARPPPKHRSTFFDDIFNIPISALNAVNQLLKNHVGKK